MVPTPSCVGTAPVKVTISHASLVGFLNSYVFVNRWSSWENCINRDDLVAALIIGDKNFVRLNASKKQLCCLYSMNYVNVWHRVFKIRPLFFGFDIYLTWSNYGTYSDCCKEVGISLQSKQVFFAHQSGNAIQQEPLDFEVCWHQASFSKSLFCTLRQN